MNEIIKYAAANRITNNKNIIIKKALETDEKDDRVIKIFAKEITSFIVRLFKNDAK